MPPLNQCTIVHILFVWSSSGIKARENLRKHGVDLADAVTLFDDELAIVVPDPDVDEERFVAIGSDAEQRALDCWRGESIRINSARRATRSETRRYYEG